MNTLVDLIFKGYVSKINFDFVAKVISRPREIKFNFPENISDKTYTSDKIIEIFKFNDYVDLIISTEMLDLDSIKFPDVFINIGCNGEEVEMLLFFDINDLNNDFQKGLDILFDWSTSFKNKYYFESFFCQTDGVNNDDNFYFRSR